MASSGQRDHPIDVSPGPGNADAPGPVANLHRDQEALAGLAQTARDKGRMRLPFLSAQSQSLGDYCSLSFGVPPWPVFRLALCPALPAGGLTDPAASAAARRRRRGVSMRHWLRLLRLAEHASLVDTFTSDPCQGH